MSSRTSIKWKFARTVLLCVGTALATELPAQSSSEISGAVPAELVELIVSAAPGTKARIYSGLFESFPLAAVPEGFSLVGGVDQGFSQALFLRSPLPAEEAEEVLLEHMQTQGWQLFADASFGTPLRGGFVAPGAASAPRNPQTLCHDRDGTLNVSAGEGSSGDVLSLRVNRLQAMQGQSCQRQAELRQGPMQRPSGSELMALMPRLELPSAEQDQPPFANVMNSGFSGSRNNVETGTTLSIDWPADALYEHFSRQLREQGWSTEGAWQSPRSAGGHWLRQVDDDTSLSGFITVLGGAGESYALRFQLQRL